MPFAAAISQHPLSAHAAGEVVGQVLESLGTAPDVAFLFVTPPHAGALEDIAAVVRSVLAPSVLVGCAAESVVGPSTEVEQTAAVSLWAGRTGSVQPVELTWDQGASTPSGWPIQMAVEPRAVVLLADPFSFDAEALLAWAERELPGVPIVGGYASAARGPGGNRLCMGARVRTDGAVGVILGSGVSVATVVSQGCRPVGRPWVVTKADDGLIYELGGRPALERLLELVDGLTDVDQRMINRGGLNLGRVIDEHKAVFGRGDFLVRNVLGADRANGAIAVSDAVDTGTTVQFHLRDQLTADEDLRTLLADASAQGALLFTCNGRGRRLFSRPHHDAAVLAEALDGAPVAGFFAAGELGPVGGRNFLHGFTASMALLQRSVTPDQRACA
jgi:small ligand-binding sensory domain FIST